MQYPLINNIISEAKQKLSRALPSVLVLIPFQKHKARALIALTAGVSLMLSACSDRTSLDANWRTYESRLSNLLEEQGPPLNPTPMPIMPRSGELRLDIDRFSINLLDSFRLDRCRLGQVVAQRNSALGNVQSTAARLRYEIDSMQAIEECLRSEVADDDRLAGILQEALEHKKQTLPLYIDQVLTRSEEFRHSMRAANSTHPVDESTGFEETLAALSYLDQLFTDVLAGDFSTVDLSPYNRHMQTLAQSDFLPKHWRTMQRNAAWLDTLNELLTDAGEKVGCRPPSIPQRAEHLHNVMMNIFAGEIQPVLARWSMYHNELVPVLGSLRDKSVQGQWQAYVDELIAEGSHAERVARLTVQHAQLWQAALAQCNMQPGTD